MKSPKLLQQSEVVKKFGKAFLRRDFELPGGKVIDYYCFGGEVPVIIFPLTKNNEVVAIRQFRYGANEILIEVPGGVVGKLTPEEATRKELEEETGYIPEKIHLLEKIWFEPAAVTVPFIPVLATGCERNGNMNLEETEIAEHVLIPLGQWCGMIWTGEINDCKTIAMTFLALKHLGLFELHI